MWHAACALPMLPFKCLTDAALVSYSPHDQARDMTFSVSQCRKGFCRILILGAKGGMAGLPPPEGYRTPVDQIFPLFCWCSKFALAIMSWTGFCLSLHRLSINACSIRHAVPAKLLSLKLSFDRICDLPIVINFCLSSGATSTHLAVRLSLLLAPCSGTLGYSSNRLKAVLKKWSPRIVINNLMWQLWYIWCIINLNFKFHWFNAISLFCSSFKTEQLLVGHILRRCEKCMHGCGWL